MTEGAQSRRERTRRLRRDQSDAIVGGVCSGIARRLGVDPIVTRAATVVLAIGTSGIALLAYLVAWAALPPDLERADAGRGRGRRRAGSWRIAIGVALLALSVLLVFRELDVWWRDALVWPVVLAAFGVTLLWNLTRPSALGAETEPPPGFGAQADGSARLELEPEARPGPPGPDARVRRRHERAGRVSVAGFGAALVLGAGLLFLWANGALDAAGEVALAAVVMLVALGLVLGPFAVRLARNLAAERRERIRSQERAEMGAHLHDSVLQTLALVRQRAADPAAVEQLARRQERELRSWLSGEGPGRPDERLADALRSVAEKVEDSLGAPIDFVAVGDCPLDEPLEALVGATGEALTNAAKFAADGGPIRLYAEISEDRVRVFVDDRGAGFDTGRIPPDRHGVRESIVGRMERHGGRAAVRSKPGEGTEVELIMERARA